MVADCAARITDRDAAQLHTPVLLQRCLDLLAPAFDVDQPVMIDCTLGMGGHTEGALERFPHLTVVGIDRDLQAIEVASKRLERFGKRFRAVHTTYDHVDDVAGEICDEFGRDGGVDGILMDLGVSSLQLDEADRGFSYARPAPLDMRMDRTSSVTAQSILDTADEREITRILRTYGEEKFASKIARTIVSLRDKGTPVTDTSALVDVVRSSIPAAARRTGGNPAKRTFQALRIAVNSELEVLENAIPAAIDSIRVGGRLVVESYQSLEDRMVKRAFTAGSISNVPADLPIIPDDHKPYLDVVTRGAERASDEDIAANPRSAPVRLRACTRLRPSSEAPATSLIDNRRSHRSHKSTTQTTQARRRA
ncbi:16S rRNA (cytosine(1402)-N(4))-methyltransferase RsmH [Actinomyces vulturis]|uniref:16S rRNA (cytosine(1402)-N(4))-methyltransferase RsmH n=1 Tax=Actinomyces vulturis TaxID=1857645 RepID=UPI00082FB4E2|nr:16S rRNA (cytosine(1402)-N(4))-methyltransferase RsmH [Actinomyces vulturis]